MKALLLCGGRSSRMGTPKHLLQLPNQKLLYQHLLEMISKVGPAALHISFHDRSSHEDSIKIGRDLVKILYDSSENDIGPAAGLLAAHHSDPGAYWLVVACDYPLLSGDEIGRIIKAYQEPVTCFENSEGWLEPLVAFWSPKALAVLKENVAKGITGPRHTVKSLGGASVKPLRESSLLNTNTPEEWRTAMELFDKMQPT